MFFKNFKKMVIYFILAVFFVCLDRFLKVLAINYYFDEEISIVGDLFKFNLAKNFNIAFSLPLNGLVLNVVIVLIIFCLLYYYLILVKKQKWAEAGCLILVIFGAVSNLIDRLSRGFVVDYLDLKYFTVFNVADMMIVGGVGGLMWLSLFCFCNKKRTTF